LDVLETHASRGADLTAVTTQVTGDASRHGVARIGEDGSIEEFWYKPEDPPTDVVLTEIFCFDGPRLLEALPRGGGRPERLGRRPGPLLRAAPAHGRAPPRGVLAGHRHPRLLLGGPHTSAGRGRRDPRRSGLADLLRAAAAAARPGAPHRDRPRCADRTGLGRGRHGRPQRHQPRSRRRGGRRGAGLRGPGRRADRLRCAAARLHRAGRRPGAGHGALRERGHGHAGGGRRGGRGGRRAGGAGLLRADGGGRSSATGAEEASARTTTACEARSRSLAAVTSSASSPSAVSRSASRWERAITSMTVLAPAPSSIVATLAEGPSTAWESETASPERSAR